MSLNLFVVGLNHKTASVQLRESVSFGGSLSAPLRQLCDRPGMHGGVILSTCNRTEIYMHAETFSDASAGVRSFLVDAKGVDASALEEHLYSYSGINAVRHLFEVVSSLDSMVLGEAQIAGQVRTAFKAALSANTTTFMLDRVFRQALEVGKRVRNQTTIGNSRISLSTVAVEVARQKFGSLQDKSVLVVGSGKMSELAARYLAEQGAKSVMVSSRTHSHACSMAKSVGATAHSFSDLGTLALQADIIISSTAAPHFVLVPEVFAGLQRPVLLLDLAMPRDIDPACADILGVSLFDLDDLGAIAQENLHAREGAAEEARGIVENEVAEIEHWVAEHAVIPTIKNIYLGAERVREAEVNRLVKELDIQLSEHDRATLDAATHAIVKKILHAPTAALRASVDTSTSYECVESARRLFEFEGAREARMGA